MISKGRRTLKWVEASTTKTGNLLFKKLLRGFKETQSIFQLISRVKLSCQVCHQMEIYINKNSHLLQTNNKSRAQIKTYKWLKLSCVLLQTVVKETQISYQKFQAKLNLQPLNPNKLLKLQVRNDISLQLKHIHLIKLRRITNQSPKKIER